MQSLAGDESRLSNPRSYHCVYENPTISKNNSLFLTHIFCDRRAPTNAKRSRLVCADCLRQSPNTASGAY
jgi:hypothetical protein